MPSFCGEPEDLCSRSRPPQTMDSDEPRWVISTADQAELESKVRESWGETSAQGGLRMQWDGGRATLLDVSISVYLGRRGESL